MPIRNNRHPQRTVTLKTLYRSDWAERIHRAFALIVPERPPQRNIRKEESHKEHPYRPLRASVQ
jgi:hypothetical protein